MSTSPHTIAVIGAGPAGLIAAETLAQAGHSVTVYDRMPSPGRKFLLAGRGGLNLTHSEPLDTLLTRYGPAAAHLAPAITAFPPEALQRFAAELGEDTFTGTSGRIFPKSFKATPLLRAWLRRLDGMGVAFRFRMHWTGWNEAGHLQFNTPAGSEAIKTDAVVLALGGASWPRLGSDGGWADVLARRGATISPLQPSNIGFSIGWSGHFRTRFAGQPLKACLFHAGDITLRAEAMITQSGIEGGAIYALSAPLRDMLARGEAILDIDLKPDVTEEALAQKLRSGRAGETVSNILRKGAGLSPVAIGLLREVAGKDLPHQASTLARRIKHVRLKVLAAAPMDRAISTAGGVAFSALDAHSMLNAAPGVFIAGEMLDWEAPTGGYLLQGCFSTGVAAANGVLAWLAQTR